MTKFTTLLLVVSLTLLWPVYPNNALAASAHVPKPASALSIDLTPYLQQSSLLRIHSLHHTYSVTILRNDQAIEEFASIGELLPHEYFSLPDNEANYRLQIKSDNGIPVTSADFKITAITFDEDNKDRWLLLRKVSKNWPDVTQRQALIEQAQQQLQTKQPANKATCAILAKLMEMQLALGQFQAALSQYDVFIRPNDNTPFCALTTLLAANANFNLYRFETAEQLYTTTLGLPQTMELLALKPYLQLMLGFSQILNGATHSNQANIELGKASIEPYINLIIEEYSQWTPTLYNALATYYSLTNDLVLAAQMLNNAINSQKQLGDGKNIAEYLNNLALVYLWTGQLNKAQKSFQESIQLARLNNDPLALSSQTANLAKSYHYIGDLATAERYYLQALEIIAQQKLNEGTATIYAKLAQIAMTQTRYQQAIRWLLASMQDALERQSNLLPLIYSHLSLAYTLSDDITQSQLFSQKALDSATFSNKENDKFNLYLTLAEVQFELGNIDACLQHLATAKAYLQPDSPDIIDYHSLAMQLAIIQASATKHQQAANAIQDHFATAFAQVKRIEQTLDFEKLGPQWMNQARTLVEQYLAYLLGNNSQENGQHALEVMESYQSTLLAKSRHYYLSLQQQSAIDDQQFNYAWKQKIEAERQLLQVDEPQRTQALRQLDLANEQFLLHKSQHLINQQTQYHFDLKAVQQQLAPQQTVLRYILLADEQWVFSVNRDNWQAFKVALLATPAELNQSPQLYQAMMANRLIPDAVLNDSSKTELLIVADKQLHQLAFSALNIASSSEHYQPLASRFSIVNSYSLSQFFQTEKRPTAVSDVDFGIFANPSFSDASSTTDDSDWLASLSQLDWSAKEADYIQQTFADARFYLALEKQATNSQLLSAPMRNARILHIATHGYYSPNNPDVVGIATAAASSESSTLSGFLSLTELLSRPVHSQLVFISGCDTVQGELWASEGLNGLARGMLALGAGSVIGTLWQVPDKATSIFVKHFYQALKTNQGDAADALQAAQLQMLKSSRYRHPKYWAGFVITSAHQQFSKIKLTNLST